MAGTTDLTRGSYAGKETHLYYTALQATPTWVPISRARNVQFNRGPALTRVDFHGANESSAVPGYISSAGSFEYVRRSGTDSVYAFLLAAKDAGDPVQMGFLNGPINEDGPTGWQMPVLLGEFQEVANGNDGVVVTIPFEKADAYASSGGAVVNYATLAGSAS